MAHQSEESASERIEGQLQFDAVGVDPETNRESSEAALIEPQPLTDDRPPTLRRVWLKNFKSFEDFTVELGRFNVLVGANNSGKSTDRQRVPIGYQFFKFSRSTALGNDPKIPSAPGQQIL
jgi:hypothetical protein